MEKALKTWKMFLLLELGNLWLDVGEYLIGRLVFKGSVLGRRFLSGLFEEGVEFGFGVQGDAGVFEPLAELVPAHKIVGLRPVGAAFSLQAAQYTEDRFDLCGLVLDFFGFLGVSDRA